MQSPPQRAMRRQPSFLIAVTGKDRLEKGLKILNEKKLANRNNTNKQRPSVPPRIDSKLQPSPTNSRVDVYAKGFDSGNKVKADFIRVPCSPSRVLPKDEAGSNYMVNRLLKQLNGDGKAVEYPDPAAPLDVDTDNSSLGSHKDSGYSGDNQDNDHVSNSSNSSAEPFLPSYQSTLFQKQRALREFQNKSLGEISPVTSDFSQSESERFDNDKTPTAKMMDIVKPLFRDDVRTPDIQRSRHFVPVVSDYDTGTMESTSTVSTVKSAIFMGNSEYAVTRNISGAKPVTHTHSQHSFLRDAQDLMHQAAIKERLGLTNEAIELCQRALAALSNVSSAEDLNSTLQQRVNFCQSEIRRLQSESRRDEPHRTDIIGLRKQSLWQRPTPSTKVGMPAPPEIQQIRPISPTALSDVSQESGSVSSFSSDSRYSHIYSAYLSRSKRDTPVHRAVLTRAAEPRRDSPKLEQCKSNEIQDEWSYVRNEPVHSRTNSQDSGKTLVPEAVHSPRDIVESVQTVGPPKSDKKECWMKQTEDKLKSEIENSAEENTQTSQPPSMNKDRMQELRARFDRPTSHTVADDSSMLGMQHKLKRESSGSYGSLPRIKSIELKSALKKQKSVGNLKKSVTFCDDLATSYFDNLPVELPTVRIDFKHGKSDSDSSDDSAVDDGKVLCNLCRKRQIEVDSVFCEHCSVYMSRFQLEVEI